MPEQAHRLAVQLAEQVLVDRSGLGAFELPKQVLEAGLEHQHDHGLVHAAALRIAATLRPPLRPAALASSVVAKRCACPRATRAACPRRRTCFARSGL